MRLTIADIARLADVSKATVSTVLNDKPGISPKTRKKVLAIVQKYGYRPSHVARSLSTRRTHTIGLVIKEIVNPYYARIIKGVFDGCTDNGYTVLLGSSELAPPKERQSIEKLLNYGVDGMIISPLQGEEIDFTYLARLTQEQYPLVMLNNVQNYATHVVDIDNVKAAFDAVCYLIGLGHRKIAYLTGPASSVHNSERLTGYQQALMNHNLPITQKFIVTAGSYIENGFRTGKALFSDDDDVPTAVLCYNDLVAIGLANALIEMNIPVPERVSIIGFDDIDFCRSFRIPLTTVHIPAYEIGKAAADLLIRTIDQPAANPNGYEKVVLPALLMERNSCATIA
ncbi:LacI family DNA-binding transcriptional regulator [candidate division KSB1 bacterium]|nr:LacI family DNA-binding transcriptional regulator [candidate division KSB1 bacterium]